MSTFRPSRLAFTYSRLDHRSGQLSPYPCQELRSPVPQTTLVNHLPSTDNSSQDDQCRDTHPYQCDALFSPGLQTKNSSRSTPSLRCNSRTRSAATSTLSHKVLSTNRSGSIRGLALIANADGGLDQEILTSTATGTNRYRILEAEHTFA